MIGPRMQVSMNRQILQVVRAEVTKVFRAPSFSIPTILLPVGFYVLFGLVMSGAARGTGPSYLLATYVVFAAMAPGLFGIGVTLAQERTSGWVDLLTASPAKPALLLVGRIAMALVFTVLSSSMIMLLAATIGKVDLAPWRWIALLLTSLFAAIPFAALGLTFGMLSGKGASALANLFFLPMAVLSGLWFPLQVLPEFLQVTARFLPTYQRGADVPWHRSRRQVDTMVDSYLSGHVVDRRAASALVGRREQALERRGSAALSQ